MDRERGRWVRCPVEEHYLKDRRKETRQERREMTARDRSKYKKTDADKRKELFDPKRMLAEGLVRARVISIASQGVAVQREEEIWHCELRGALKKEKTQQKNIVAVGDYVWVAKKSAEEGSICAVEPRKTVLSRADNLSRRKEQIIATNIDQVLITASVVDPLLKPSLIDRYIIAARKGGMDPIIVVNKIDKLSEQGSAIAVSEAEVYQECLQAYQKASIPIIGVSAATGEGLEELHREMRDCSSVFSGQSGVGKTSLINYLTHLNLRVSETVARTRKGSHTTTSANLISLPSGGWCVDTPGIRSFGVWNLSASELQGYFTEIYEVGRKCAFTNCTHSHEMHCAVKTAVEAQEISFMRFMSYQALMQSIQEEHVRR